MPNRDTSFAVAAIAAVDVVPTLLKVLCDMTGLRFAAIARVAGTTWTACALRDELGLRMTPGGQLAFMKNFRLDMRAACQPIVIERASTDPRYSAARRAIGSGQVETLVCVPIVLKDRRYFGALCAMDARPVEVSQPRILAMFKDFASLIAAQLEKQAVREQEQEDLLDERSASELREQFIAILGHDLRNPLHAVQASGEMLERKLTDPAQRAIASRIRTQTKRMSLLINDVLDFARGRLGGGIGLEMIDVDNMNSGLESVIQELRDSQTGVEIQADIDVSRPVRCDLSRVQQVASNLLGNAITHAQRQSAVKIAAKTDENDLVLDVWNAGEPIPSDSLPKIFEPFWRRSGPGNRAGLGLGLHICAQIMRAHAGRISVISSQEGGTQFTARLPLRGSSFGSLDVLSAESGGEFARNERCGNS